jgi:hypothetical protein
MTADRARLLGALDRLGIPGLGSVAVADVPEVAVAEPLYTLALDAAVDTNAATLELGLNATTYQPDAFPGVVYQADPTVLVFGTGQVVVTDAADRAAAGDAVAGVVARLVETDLIDAGAVPDAGVEPVDLPAMAELPPVWADAVEEPDEEPGAGCPDCGADLDGTENFCPACGAALS